VWSAAVWSVQVRVGSSSGSIRRGTVKPRHIVTWLATAPDSIPGAAESGRSSNKVAHASLSEPEAAGEPRSVPTAVAVSRRASPGLKMLSTPCRCRCRCCRMRPFYIKAAPSARRAAGPGRDLSTGPGITREVCERSEVPRRWRPGGDVSSLRGRQLGPAPLSALGAPARAAAAGPLPRARRRSVRAVTHVGDRTNESSRAVLPCRASCREDEAELFARRLSLRKRAGPPCGVRPGSGAHRCFRIWTVGSLSAAGAAAGTTGLCGCTGVTRR
jgi:hypothetical protein